MYMGEITERDIKLALQRPDSFMMWNDEGKDWFTTWGLCGPVKHRDSGTLDRSNYEVIYADLKRRFPRQIESYSSDHWAHGWMDQIACQVLTKKGKPTKAFEALLEWRDRLMEYAVADEMHFSELEWEEFMDTLECIFGRNGDISEVSSFFFDEFNYCTGDSIQQKDIEEVEEYLLIQNGGWD